MDRETPYEGYLGAEDVFQEMMVKGLSREALSEELEALEAVLEAYHGNLQPIAERMKLGGALFDEERTFWYRFATGDYKRLPKRPRYWKNYEDSFAIWWFVCRCTDKEPEVKKQAHVAAAMNEFGVSESRVNRALKAVEENLQMDDHEARGVAYRYRLVKSVLEHPMSAKS